jgi:hypothetical protein
VSDNSNNPTEGIKVNPGLNGPSDDSKRFRLLAILVGVAVVILVCVLAFSRHTSPTAKHNATAPTAFTVTGTTPQLNTLNTQSPSLTINFSKTLAAGSASITSNPHIITATSISGKTVTLTLTPRTMLNSKTYTVDIASISDTTGERITSKTLKFTPSFAGPIVSGEDILTNEGLSSVQLSSLNSYLAGFDPWAQNISIDPSSVKHYQVSQTDEWSPWAYSFAMTIDGAAYNVVCAFDDTEDLQVTINNASNNQQVFQTGSVGSYQ